jgi:hypothetical protein
VCAVTRWLRICWARGLLLEQFRFAGLVASGLLGSRLRRHSARGAQCGWAGSAQGRRRFHLRVFAFSFSCAASLQDDIRGSLPDLLPKFVTLFAEAERSGCYDRVPDALRALQSLGPALEVRAGA